MIFKGKNYDVGDKVLVKTFSDETRGILLESYEQGVLLIKLESGYNIGIDKSNIVEIKVLEKPEKKEVEEKPFELSHKKPIIDLIITGGTIASSLDSKTGGVKFLTTPETFFKFYPEIFEVADIRVINPFMTWSENMNFSHWKKIAKLAAKSLSDPNVKGVIVTHGTDFLHYTGSALSFMLRNVTKPVVLTYSQKSIDRGSSDAELNLYCAAKVCLSDIAGVMLVGHANMNDEYCYALQANKARKLHASKRDAFKPVNTEPIAKIYRDKIEVMRNYDKRKTGKDAKTILEDYFEDKIALIKFYPGQSPDILDYYFKLGYKGAVIEAAGMSNVTNEGEFNWLPALKKVIDKGFIVCFAPQTIYGSLNPKPYESGRRIEKTGVIYLKDMLCETAFVKLGWVLGKLKEEKIKITKENVEKLMLKNISGEFNERLGESFI